MVKDSHLLFQGRLVLSISIQWTQEVGEHKVAVFLDFFTAYDACSTRESNCCGSKNGLWSHLNLGSLLLRISRKVIEDALVFSVTQVLVAKQLEWREHILRNLFSLILDRAIRIASTLNVLKFDLIKIVELLLDFVILQNLILVTSTQCIILMLLCNEPFRINLSNKADFILQMFSRNNLSLV